MTKALRRRYAIKMIRRLSVTKLLELEVFFCDTSGRLSADGEGETVKELPVVVEGILRI